MSYAAAVLASTPDLLWMLDAGVAKDLSGNGRDGILAGTPTPGSVPLIGDAKSTYFNAGGDGYSRAFDAAWMTSTWSVEAVCRYESGMTVASRYSSSFGVSAFSLRFDSAVPNIYVFAGGGYTNIGGSAFAVGQKGHIAATYNGSTGATVLYVNGASVNTATIAGGNAGTAAFYCGRRDNAAAEDFTGNLAGIAHYNRVLTAAEVLAHARAWQRSQVTY